MIHTASPTLETARALVGDRLRRVEDELRRMLPSGFELMDEVNEYVFSNSGKMLRPTLLLICNEVGDRRSREAVRLAALVELLHVATLVHDDAVDHSPRRRGMPTVNERWTHQVAIIVGDYLYSRAVIEITALGNLEAIDLLARTANRMTIGELRQLTAHDALDFTRDDYFLLCDCKTATLIATACELGALAGDHLCREPLREYGFQLGLCFQITDDLLDYSSEPEVTGKPSGLDLREHKVTLPLILALPEMDETARGSVGELFAAPEPTDEQVSAVREAVFRFGGVDGARDEARRVAADAREALGGLPIGMPREALEAAVDFVVNRVS